MNRLDSKPKTLLASALLMILFPIQTVFAQIQTPQALGANSHPMGSRTDSPPATIYKACALVSGSSARGSGFWVNPNTFVTCLHVVAEGGDNLSIKTIDGGSFHIASVRNYSTNDDDVIVVTTVPDNPNWLNLKDSIDPGTHIWSVGNSEGARVLKTDSGEITGVGDAILEVTAQIRPGCSGGPILDIDGNVVGMSAFLAFPMVSITPAVSIADTQSHYKHDFSLTNARKFAIRSATIQKYLGAASWPITVQEIQAADSDKQCTPLLLAIHKFISQSIYDALATKLQWNQNLVKDPDHTEQQRLYPNAQHGQLGYNSIVFQTVPGQVREDNHVLIKGDPAPLVDVVQRCQALADVINDPTFRIYEGHPSQLTSHLLANLQTLLVGMPEFADEYLKMQQTPTADGAEQIAKVEKLRRKMIAVQRAYMAQIGVLRARYGNASLQE